ncbi:hypothetical protein D3C80_1731200 [compost metagenome]
MSGFIDTSVKGPVHFSPTANILTYEKIVEDGNRPGEMTFGEVWNRISGDFDFQQHPHLENLSKLSLTDSGNQSPSVTLKLHQPFSFKTLERFPYRNLADVEGFSDLVLADGLILSDFTADNRIPEVLGDDL